MTTAPVMTITEELLADLHGAASALSDGEWFDAESAMGCTGICREDAEFIAAANPATILALIDHIGSLSERLGMAKKALAPFAKCAELFDDDMRSSNMPSSGTFHSWPRLHHEYELTVEDLRAARYAIAQESADHE